MKKILTLFIVVLMVFSMTACGDTSIRQTNRTLALDDHLVTVDITLPATMFENAGNLNMENYAMENGFKKAVKNPDGSVTITVSKAKHKEMLAELEAGVDESFEALVNGQDTPYIKDITHTDNFETVTADVDRTDYEGAFFNMTPLVLGMNAMVYRIYTGDEISTEVIIRDAKTKEVMSSAIYPNALTEK